MIRDRIHFRLNRFVCDDLVIYFTLSSFYKLDAYLFKRDFSDLVVVGSDKRNM